MEKKQFSLWDASVSVHKMVASLEDYPMFLFKFIVMNLFTLICSLAFVVFVYGWGDDIDFDDISPGFYVAFTCLGLLNIIGEIMPGYSGIMVDSLKTELQVLQGTSIVRKLFDFEHNEIVSTPTGEFAQLITKVYMNVDKVVPSMYQNILPLLIEGIVSTIVLSVLFGPIGLIQIGLLIVYSIGANYQAGTKVKRDKQIMMVMFSQWGKILAAANTYEIAHFFDNVDYEVTRAGEAFEIIGEKFRALTTGEHKDKVVIAFSSNIWQVGWMLVLLSQLSNDNITTFEFVALAYYYFSFLAKLAPYAVAFANLRRALEEFHAINEFLQRSSAIADADDALVLQPSKNPVIEFKNVTFSYKDKLILDNVSFKIEGGQTLGIVGASGCGKSTILRLLLRFYKHESGEITVDGKDISKVTAKSLRDLFSIITQDTHLFNGTIEENIRYGKKGATLEDISTAATQAELIFDDEKELKEGEEAEFGLSTQVGEKGAKLSGGQQQRVAIARAMIKKGSVFLLDEPTTGLDGVVAQQVAETLSHIAKDSTTIMITHKLERLVSADQIIYLKGGKIIEAGTYNELVDLKGEFWKQAASAGRHVGNGEGKTDQKNNGQSNLDVKQIALDVASDADNNQNTTEATKEDGLDSDNNNSKNDDELVDTRGSTNGDGVNIHQE